MSPLDEVAKVADAVLFEGYLLYPYRASAQKNRIRWQFGVLTPDKFGEANHEQSANQTECLLEPRDDAGLQIRLRCLQLQARSLLDIDGQPIEELVVDGIRHMRFEEGIPREFDLELTVAELVGETKVIPVEFPASVTTDPLADEAGEVVGQIRRECWPLNAQLKVGAEELPGPYDVLKLRLVVENIADVPGDVEREVALQYCLIAAHSMLAVSNGEFISLTDSPEWAKPMVAACVNTHTWPVLAGPPERSDLLLSSPIILDDHPQLAPESTIDLFDGLENDEILTLRTLVLTDEEKREARATDPRTASIIDAVDNMPPEIFERLHGVIRSMRELPNSGPSAVGGGDVDFATSDELPMWSTVVGADSPAEQPEGRMPWWDPASDASVDPEKDHVLIDGAEVAKGSQVLLQPGPRSDAQDEFLRGMVATVQAVVHDVDGGVHVAVSLNDDPGVDMQLAHGRYRYFAPTELQVAQ